MEVKGVSEFGLPQQTPLFDLISSSSLLSLVHPSVKMVTIETRKKSSNKKTHKMFLPLSPQSMILSWWTKIFWVVRGENGDRKWEMMGLSIHWGMLDSVGLEKFWLGLAQPLSSTKNVSLDTNLSQNPSACIYFLQICYWFLVTQL